VEHRPRGTAPERSVPTAHRGGNGRPTSCDGERDPSGCRGSRAEYRSGDQRLVRPHPRIRVTAISVAARVVVTRPDGESARGIPRPRCDGTGEYRIAGLADNRRAMGFAVVSQAGTLRLGGAPVDSVPIYDGWRSSTDAECGQREAAILQTLASQGVDVGALGLERCDRPQAAPHLLLV
jgi:hypothetical protein